MMKCPICEGEGRFVEHYEAGTTIYSDCSYCNAAGNISLRGGISHWFWTHVPVGFIEWYYDHVIKEKE